MVNETPEAKRAELIRFRLEELKYLLEEVGKDTSNKMMIDFRNQLAHCAITYSPYGTVFMRENSVARQITDAPGSHIDEEIAGDGHGYKKVYVTVGGKRKILSHVYPLEQWEELYNRFRAELSQAGALIPLPRTTLGCPQCGDFPVSRSGHGQDVCSHVRDGIEKAYIRDEFGDITSYLTFKRSPNNVW